MTSMSWFNDMGAVQYHGPLTTHTTPADETYLLRWLFAPDIVQCTDTLKEDSLASWPFVTQPPRWRSPTYPPSYARKRTYECSICTEKLPLRCFLNRCSTVMPSTCYHHLALKWPFPENVGRQREAENSEPVCRSCLSRYLTEQFRTRGAERIQCIKTGCTPPYPDQAWKYFAIHFLPKELRSSFNEELARAFHKRDTWICPADCGCEIGWTTTPNRTNGWPHVECPSCNGRFCATCRVPWHDGLSCQKFQRASRWQKQSYPTTETSPSSPCTIRHSSDRSVIDKKDTAFNYRSLREMQARGARLCPRCQTPIIKDGGCNHMWCIKCELHFTWREAEKVYAIRQDNAVVKRFRGPLRCIGAWVWMQRAKWGMWRAGKRKGAVICDSDDNRSYGYNEGHVVLDEDEGGREDNHEEDEAGAEDGERE